jgi:hypothetical protein
MVNRRLSRWFLAVPTSLPRTGLSTATENATSDTRPLGAGAGIRDGFSESSEGLREQPTGLDQIAFQAKWFVLLQPKIESADGLGLDPATGDVLASWDV